MKTLFRTFLIVAGFISGMAAHGTPLPNGVDPANLGKGDWIWDIPSCKTALGVSTPAAVLDYEKAKGMQWVTVKCGDGGSIWSQFDSSLVSHAHAIGLKIFGWGFAYGSDVTGEINVAKNCLALGADGFIIDAESAYEKLAGNGAAATNYCAGIRAAYPNTFLAHAPFPYITLHSGFPYLAFGIYCDAVMPQDYWSDLGVSPTKMVSDTDTQWKNWQNALTGSNRNAIKPIVPIGQGYNYSSTKITPGSEITTFVDTLKADASPATSGGYKGVSFWSCQHHTSDQWSAIGAETIGSPSNIPSAPTNLVALARSSTLVTLTWGDTSTNETGFKIERAAGAPSGFVQTTAVNLNVTSYSDTGLAPSTTYYYRIRASNTNGNSDYTTISSTTTSNSTPVLAAIADQTVDVLQTMVISNSTTDADGSITNPVTDFETDAVGSSPMFRVPSYSSTTSGFIGTNVTSSAAVTSTFPTGHAGTNVLKATWAFATGTTNPWLRLTTFNATTLPNPIVDFTKVVQFDVYCDKAIKLALGLRETNTTGAIGTDGGTTGTIEFAGATTNPDGSPAPTRTISANTWTTLKFNLPSEPIAAFTGNGILSTTTGKGVLEHLAVVPAGGSGTYNLYLDNFNVVKLNALTYSLVSGAPTGMSINPTNGILTWTPTSSQGPATYSVSVKVTDNGTPPLSNTKTFNVTVNKLTNAPVAAVPMTNDHFHAQFAVNPGVSYAVQVSTNLSDPSAWTTILTTNPATATVEFVDPNPADFTNCFYRILLQ